MINVLSKIFPVFFMIILGIISKKKNLISQKGREGINDLVFKVLFPIMIFNLLFSADFKTQYLLVIIYILISYLFILFIGKLLSNFTGKKYSSFSNLLLITQECGSVALPLFLSICPGSSVMTIIDLASLITCFIILPVIVQKKTSESNNIKEILINTIKNPFVIAVILGLFGNFTGLYNVLYNSDLFDLYSSVVNMATTPIVSIILFGIGYDIKFEKETFIQVSKLILVRILLYVLVIFGFFLLFPSLMKEKEFMIAVIIYFTSPVGFGTVPIISPLFKDKDDASYASAFVSGCMIISLMIYVFTIIFII